MSIFTNWPQQAEQLLRAHLKKCGFACKWLGNVDMHMHAKCDKNIPCGSIVMNIFTNW